MRQRLGQAQLFPATEAPASAGQVPATDPPSSAGQIPATNSLSSAGQLPAMNPLFSAGQLPATDLLSSAEKLPATNTPPSAKTLPARDPPSSAGRFPATNPLSTAGQLSATDLPSSAGKLLASRPSPANLPSSVARHAGSPLPALPYSLDSSSADASLAPATKAQSPAASEREVLQTSELSQLQPANSSMPASPIALPPQLQLQMQAQDRSSLAPAQLQPQMLSCPSRPPEKTQQPTGPTAVAPTCCSGCVKATAVAVVHPEQQHVVSQRVAGSFAAAVQAPNLAQVHLHRLLSASALLNHYPIVTAACLAISTLSGAGVQYLTAVALHFILLFRHPQLWHNKLHWPQGWPQLQPTRL